MFDNTKSALGSHQGRAGIAVAKCNSAPAFLTRPVFAPEIPARITWTKPGSATTQLAEMAFTAGWVSDESLRNVNRAPEAIQVVSEAVSNRFSVPQRSDTRFSVGVHAKDALREREYDHVLFGSDEIVAPTDEVVVFSLDAMGDQTMLPLSKSMDRWNQLHPQAEHFCAHVLKKMEALPFIWTPYDVQDVISEQIFDWGEDLVADGEDLEGSLYDRKQLDTLPSLWRCLPSSPTAGQCDPQLSLPGLSTQEHFAALFATKNLLAQKLFATGDQIIRMRERVIAIRRQLNIDVWRSLSDLMLVLPVRQHDVLADHFDQHYDSLMQDYSQTVLMAAVKPVHDDLNKFADEMRTFLNYLDLCVHFVELLNTGAEEENG